MEPTYFVRLMESRPDPEAPMSGELLGEFGEKLESLATEVKARESRVTADVGTLIASAKARIDALPGLDSETRQRALDAEIAKARTDVRVRHGVTDEVLVTWRRDIAIAEASLRRQESFLESDAGALTRATLASPQRATFIANLSISGLAERRAAHDLARTTADPVLASALLSVDGALPQDKRLLDPAQRAQLAASCLPPQVVAERERVKQLRLRVDDARRRLESLTGQPASPLTKIARGLRAGGARNGRGSGAVSRISDR